MNSNFLPNRKVQLAFGSTILVLLAVGTLIYHSFILSAEMKTALILGVLAAGLTVGFAGWSVHRDTAGRERTEETLRNSEEKDRLLLDEIQDYAIFMLDPLGTVISWNAGAQRIKGYTAEQIIGRNFSCRRIAVITSL
jgi:PAS domain-containing protein